MGVIIECSGKEILDCKNITFGIIFENILEIIEEKDLQLDEHMKYIINNVLYQAQYGVGFDIADILKTKEDALFFSDLMKEAIERFEKSIPNPELISMLWNFHKELPKYAKELQN